MNTFFLTLLLISFIGVLYSDAKGIRIGGVKVPKPKISVPLSVPKPRIPLIVPVILPIGVGGGSYGYSRRRLDKRLQCYVCEGNDNEICAVSPAGHAKRMTCPENHYCSVVRMELPKGSVIEKNATIANVTESTVDVSNTTELAVSSTTSPEYNSTEMATSEATTLGTPSSTSDDVATRTRRDAMVVRISRGCKSFDFLEGTMLTASGNSTDKVYAQLCSTDLCNTGDGRLKCYECQGSGDRHACMVDPSRVANVITCQPNESCFMERIVRTINSSTSNSTERIATIQRGCRASSILDDNENINPRTDGVLSLSCRLGDFCNKIDANRLVRSVSKSSASGSITTASTLALSLLVTLITHI